MTFHLKHWFAFLVLFGLSHQVRAAPLAPETYSRLRLGVGGYYYAGNVNQIQGNMNLHYGLSSPSFGLDLLANGYRLWSRASDDDEYTRVGDDFFATFLPFNYITERLYVAGLTRYESSRIQQLDHRLIFGAGVGIAAARSKEVLIRVSLVPSYEFSYFAGSNFRIEVPHDGSRREVVRLSVLSNGWYRVTESAVTLRYFLQLYPDSTFSEDLRLNLTGNVDVRLAEQLSIRTSLVYNRDEAILEGREPYDVRSTIGIVWTTE